MSLTRDDQFLYDIDIILLQGLLNRLNHVYIYIYIYLYITFVHSSPDPDHNETTTEYIVLGFLFVVAGINLVVGVSKMHYI